MFRNSESCNKQNSAIRCGTNTNHNDNATEDFESFNVDPKEELEQKLDHLTQALEEQKKHYQNQMYLVKEQSDRYAKSAKQALDSMRSKYMNYKMKMETKLGTPESSLSDGRNVEKMQQEIEELKERAQAQQKQLTQAQEKLAMNLEARKSLQAEMVSFKYGYLQRLSELEDAIEREQDARVRDQQEARQTLDLVQQQHKQRVRQIQKESQRQRTALTAEYQEQLMQREKECEQMRAQVREMEELVQEHEKRLITLQQERRSLRKLLAQAWQLLRQRIANRLSSSSSSLQQPPKI